MSTPLEYTASPTVGHRPVILIHGLASTGERDWAGWADALTAAGRSPYIVDLPGHGASAPVADEDDVTTSAVIRSLAELIDTACRETETTNADVIAYSLGARLAWDLPAASNRVATMVLGGMSAGDPLAALDVAALRATAVDGAEPADPMIGMMAGMLAQPGNDTASLVRAVAGIGSEPLDTSRVPTVPTLFVAGSEDPMSQGIDALVETVPRAQLQRVPGDHMGALASSEFREAALSFIS